MQWKPDRPFALTSRRGGGGRPFPFCASFISLPLSLAAAMYPPFPRGGAGTFYLRTISPDPPAFRLSLSGIN